MPEDPQGWTAGPAPETSAWTPGPAPAPARSWLDEATDYAKEAFAGVNPVNIAKGVSQAVMHPIDTIRAVGQAQGDLETKAADAFKRGEYATGMRHAINYMLPLIGPRLDQAGDYLQQGQYAKGLGASTDVALQTMGPAIAAPAVTAAREALTPSAASLEAGAASRYADVMAPKIGPNKTRFGGMAQDVAPTLAADPTMGALSRDGLAAKVSDRLAQAESALDDANDARLAARSFKTQPMIDALQAKRQQFVAQPVEGTQVAYTRGPGGFVNDASGEVLPNVTGATGHGPIGSPVVPGPNAARVGVLDRAIGELQQLGDVTRYDEIRKLRQAYDGPAKAIYSPAMTADYMTAQGGKLGAADVTGVLRDQLAQWDPDTAAANADYSFYRKADDVLSATAEVERTRPKVGRQIMARLTGTIGGGQLGGPAGAAAGFVLAPVVESALASGATTKLATAQVMGKLATAIRTGDLGHVTSLTYQLQRAAPAATPAASAVRLAGAAAGSGPPGLAASPGADPP